MLTLIVLGLVAMTGLIVLLMAYQAYTGTVDLLSLRNFFFLGLLIFQVTSAIVPIKLAATKYYPIEDFQKSAMIFFIGLIVFLVLFLGTYTTGPFVKKIARLIPQETLVPSSTTLLMLSGVLLGLGMLTRYGLGLLPVVGGGLENLGVGIIVMSAGVAAYSWAPRMMNPIIALIAGAIIMAAMVNFMGGWGRRNLASLVVAVAWGLFHGHWKSLGFQAYMSRIAVAGLAGLVVIGTYTSARAIFGRDASRSDVAKTITQRANIREGMMEVIQREAPIISIYIIDSRPERIEYDTLHSLWSFVSSPMPRQFWPDKPVSLAETVPNQAKIRLKAKNYNIGPGIIGHIWNDNPMLALWMYPILLGLFFRLFDEIILRNPYNPFLLLPIGSAVGQVLGVPRGELAYFLRLGVSQMFAAFFVMLLTVKVLKTMGVRMEFTRASAGGTAELYDDGWDDDYGDADDDTGDSDEDEWTADSWDVDPDEADAYALESN